jgi:hypothetical protein
MKTQNEFSIVIYQLDKTGENSTFEYTLKGTTDLNSLEPKRIAKFVSNKVFKLYRKQQSIAESEIKQRFFHLAKSKPLYVLFELNGSRLFDTELFQSMKVKLSEADTEAKLTTLLDAVIDVIADNNENEL